MKDISRILRRDCPLENEILEGCRTVENHNDNIWPLNGEQDLEVAETRWDKGNELALIPNKRRKVESNETGDKLIDWHGPTYSSNLSTRSFIGTTTMQNRSTFSYQGTTGFISAATQLHQVDKEVQIRESATEKKRPLDSVAGSRELHARAPKPTKTDEEQVTLLRFWAVKADINDPGKSIASPQDSSPYAYQRSQMKQKQKAEPATLCNTMAPKSSTSLPVIPKGLADHKVRSIANTSRPYLSATERCSNSKQYVFLSSSPPPFTDPQENSDSISDVLTVGSQSRPNIDNSEPGKVGDCRPATTFHTTSLARLRATSSFPKKTLGVRRSMTGWPPRRNQGFSIPTRTMDLP